MNIMQVLLLGGPRDGDILSFEKGVNFTNYFDTTVNSTVSSNKKASFTGTYTKKEITIDSKEYAYATCEDFDLSVIESRIKESNLQPVPQ